MQIPNISVEAVCVVAFVVAVAIADLRSHRIPNLLTAPAAAAGVLVSLLAHGAGGLVHSLGGLLAGLAVFLPFYLMRGFGAGDVKAMAAIGAFLGLKGVLLAAAWTLVAGALGGLLALVTSGGHRALHTLLHRWLARVVALAATGRAVPIEIPAGDPARQRFPYGLAIACGTVASFFWS